MDPSTPGWEEEMHHVPLVWVGEGGSSHPSVGGCLWQTPSSQGVREVVGKEEHSITLGWMIPSHRVDGFLPQTPALPGLRGEMATGIPGWTGEGVKRTLSPRTR